MKREPASLRHIPLAPGTKVVRPSAPPSAVDAQSPALEVMTDFRYVWSATIGPDASIEGALARMKDVGVRLLLVVNAEQEIVGLITARDIHSDRPAQLTAEAGLARDRIKVSQIMTPQTAIEVLDLQAVLSAQVGDIVTILGALRRQHALVVEVDRKSGEQVARGVFSSTEIARRLGKEPSTPGASTAAEGDLPPAPDAGRDEPMSC